MPYKQVAAPTQLSAQDTNGPSLVFPQNGIKFLSSQELDAHSWEVNLYLLNHSQFREPTNPGGAVRKF